MLNPARAAGGWRVPARPRLSRDRRGLAAIEFAFVLPVMLLFIVGVFDISKALILYQQVYNTAHSVPVAASSLAVQPDRSTSLTVTQVQQTLSAVYAEMPWVRDGIETGARSVTMTSVVFLPVNAQCVASATVTCPAVPNVAWSVAYFGGNATGFQNVVRPCGTLNQTAPTAGTPGDLTSLRTADVTNPDPILVVDVHYRYTPFFFTFVTGPLDFWASGYWPVRSVAPNSAPATQYTHYDPTNQNGGAGKCPGFS
jgi:Flp pilus assembly protein TadG